MTGLWKTEKAKQIYTVDIPSVSQTAHEPSTELTIKKKSIVQNNFIKYRAH
jgi:hypothetical protein